MLKMSDEKGGDAKLIAVPIKKQCAMYDKVETLDDVPKALLDQIAHFFEHYKDLEPGKWVKLDGWGGMDDAVTEIKESVERYEATQ
jgi:inorganic pyrophosphatase